MSRTEHPMRALVDLRRAMRALEQHASETDSPAHKVVVATDLVEAAIVLLHEALEKVPRR